MLMQHYEGMDDGSDGERDIEDFKPEVKVEVKEEVMDPDQEQEEEEDLPTPPAMQTQAQASAGGVGDNRQMVNGMLHFARLGFLSSSRLTPLIVNGVPKALDDVTEDDQEEMTPDEYQVSHCLLAAIHISYADFVGILRYCCVCMTKLKKTPHQTSWTLRLAGLL